MNFFHQSNKKAAENDSKGESKDSPIPCRGMAGRRILSA